MKRALRYSLAVCLISWLIALIFYLITGDTGISIGDLDEYQSQTLVMMAFSSGYMFLPLLIAVGMGCFEKRRAKKMPNADSKNLDLGFRSKLMKFKLKWSWLVGSVLVLLIVALSILINGCFAIVEIDWKASHSINFLSTTLTTNLSTLGFLVITTVVSLLAGWTINALVAFGEEYGWRRYMVDALQGEKFWKAALIIGIVWGLWHFPLILMGHNYPEHRIAGVFMMCGITLFIGIIELYFVIKARSVYPAAIIHGTFNALAGMDLLFVRGGNDLLNGATGVSGILAMAIVIGLLFLYDTYGSKERIFLKTIENGLSDENTTTLASERVTEQA